MSVTGSPNQPPVTDEGGAAMSPEDTTVMTTREYLGLAWSRLQGGETGVLPVIGGLLLVSILFQILNNRFLTAGNLVNLMLQAAVFSLLAMGEVFVLLLGEIDLSVGFVAGLSAVVLAKLADPTVGWPWWAAVLVALAVAAGIGLIQGTLITRIGLPSFVVTLGGQLFWQGVMLWALGNGGSVLIQSQVLNGLTSSNLTPLVGWVVMLVAVGFVSVLTWRRDARRRSSGLAAPPVILTVTKILGGLLGGVALILLANTDRGVRFPVVGLPWVVVLVLAVLAGWTYLLSRRRFGRYLYAIGGNAEAARRAGIRLPRIRTLAFVLCSLTAGVGGIVYASRLRSISTALDGGTLVLYAIAAAVIGGTSLFGGRGKALHGVLGGVVIAAIDNGMGLLGVSAAAKYVVTALVLIIAVTIDAIARRNRPDRR